MPATTAELPSAIERPPTAILALGVFGLFSMWSMSFISIEALLGATADHPARFDWLGLTIARFLPAALLSLTYLVLARRAESHAVLARRWPRLLACGLLMVPGYNFALYAGQQLAVPAPVASMLTALAPLFVMLLSALFLGEPITARRAIGFTIALAGLATIALSRPNGGRLDYPLVIALTALAPVCWSMYTVLTKPATREVSPLVWTYLAVIVGTAPLLPFAPRHGLPGMARLDLAGWGWLMHLSVLCTVVGFGLWTWLLRHLPATSVAFMVFLNPPMTTGYKLLLSRLAPGAFQFQVARGEIAGGGLLLAGVAVAILARRRRG